MNSDELYTEFTKHFETISRRLGNIEMKMDQQYERDHQHELKLLEAENKINALTEKTNENLASIQANNGGLKRDADNLADKIRDIENTPAQKKARIVDQIVNRSFEIVLAALVGGAIAWFIARLK
jgi:predicted  nucleic acid-binding Zn-ribbon protein